MRRIVVTGSPGSGKSTLARRLAAQLDLPYHELAALYWRDDWQPAPPDGFAAQVTALAAGECWVIDGLYLKDLLWQRADTLIWLDYSAALVVWRLLRRTLRRIRSRETLWQTTNRETWRHSLFSRHALIWRVLFGHYARRRRYLRRLRKPAYAHLQVERLRSPRAADRWLRGIAIHAH